MGNKRKKHDRPNHPSNVTTAIKNVDGEQSPAGTAHAKSAEVSTSGGRRLIAFFNRISWPTYISGIVTIVMAQLLISAFDLDRPVLMVLQERAPRTNQLDLKNGSTRYRLTYTFQVFNAAWRKGLIGDCQVLPVEISSFPTPTVVYTKTHPVGMWRTKDIECATEFIVPNGVRGKMPRWEVVLKTTEGEPIVAVEQDYTFDPNGRNQSTVTYRERRRWPLFGRQREVFPQ